MLVNIDNVNLEKLKECLLFQRNMDKSIYNDAKNFEISYKELGGRQYIALKFERIIYHSPFICDWYLPVEQYIGAVTRTVLIEKIIKWKNQKFLKI